MKKTIEYNKLVRDRIPDIIQSKGKSCQTRIIKDSNLILELLEKKLQEEWAEYLENREVKELADVLEVVFSLASRLGTDQDDLIALCEKKRKERGAFDNGIFLDSVTEP